MFLYCRDLLGLLLPFWQAIRCPHKEWHSCLKADAYCSTCWRLYNSDVKTNKHCRTPVSCQSKYLDARNTTVFRQKTCQQNWTIGQHGIVINTSPRTWAGWRGRKCIYATLWRGTRPQGLKVGKKAAAQEMWCNRVCHDAPRFVHFSACQGCVLFCSLWVSGSSFQLWAYGWFQYIRLF